MLLELATYDTRRKVNSQHGSMKMGAYLFQVHCQAASISDNRDLANDTLKGLVARVSRMVSTKIRTHDGIPSGLSPKQHRDSGCSRRILLMSW